MATALAARRGISKINFSNKGQTVLIARVMTTPQTIVISRQTYPYKS